MPIYRHLDGEKTIKRYPLTLYFFKPVSEGDVATLLPAISENFSPIVSGDSNNQKVEWPDLYVTTGDYYNCIGHIPNAVPVILDANQNLITPDYFIIAEDARRTQRVGLISDLPAQLG